MLAGQHRHFSENVVKRIYKATLFLYSKVWHFKECLDDGHVLDALSPALFLIVLIVDAVFF